MIVVVGLSHKSAPIEVRERLAIPRTALPDLLARLKEQKGIGEAVVLSTCNRVEVYAAAPGRTATDAELIETARSAAHVLRSVGGDPVAAHLQNVTGPAAVLHLFRVAASLDSLVVGEPQILGQLKDAIEVARGSKALGGTLGQLMHRAVRVGKRVRTETQIGAGQVSVSSVAVDLARDIFGDLAGHTALLVGAGDMAEAASKLLVKAGAKLLITNRSPERATELAREVGGETRPWADLGKSLVEADVVVSSTSAPGYVITLDLIKGIRKARRGRSLFLIDIAVPRDVEPAVGELENVYLWDVDNLSQAVAESREGRASEAGLAEAIALEEARGFATWTLEQALTPAIVGLRERTKAVLAGEVERSLNGKLKHLGAAEREALSVMVEAATNKLLHAPSTRLRALAGDPRAADYVDAIRELFALEEAADSGQPRDTPMPSGPRVSRDPDGRGVSTERPLRPSPRPPAPREAISMAVSSLSRSGPRES